MLQDLSFGKLENEYRLILPEDGDYVFCFRDKEILVAADNGCLVFPTAQQVKSWSVGNGWSLWNHGDLQYLFRFQEKNCFLWMGTAGEGAQAPFSYTVTRGLRNLDAGDNCYAAMTAWHLFHWYRTNRYCGNCGTPTVHDSAERMLRCPNCGNMIFPRINPAVIVAVTDGDRLLLTKYAGRSFANYALVAGFTEIGETMEQTVTREVMEEVGLRVKNIRYYKSQPWGVDGNILMGFYCDLDGEDAIHLDERELSVGEWHQRGSIPAKDDGYSLTREMIRIFDENHHPK